MRIVDMSRGKPYSKRSSGDAIVHQTDLLWPYHLSRIAIDSWAEAAENASGMTSNYASDLEIMTSPDGETWTLQNPEWVVASDKSTLGSGPTWVGILENVPVARYVHVTQSRPRYEVRVRCHTTSRYRATDEMKKYSMSVTNTNRDDEVRVVMVGGSNTVMRHGWSRSLAELPTRIAASAALGASSNIFAVRTLADHPKPEAEVLLYNANVIEYPLMKSETYDFDLARDATRHVLAYCHRHNLFPVNIIWPEQSYLKARDSGDWILAGDTYFKNLCHELDMPFVDGYQVLDELTLRLGRSHASLFRDGAHLNHFAAQLIGRSISRVIANLKSEKILQSRTTAPELTRSFKTLEAIDAQSPRAQSDFVKCRVSNNLITQDLIQLGLNEVISSEVDDGWEVVGYLLNARRCNASIRISGENVVVKRANFSGFNPASTASPLVCIRALPFPIRPKNGKVQLSAVAPSPEDVPDRLLSSTDSPDPNSAVIEIGQIILRSQLNLEPRAAVMGTTLDLTSRVIEQLDVSEARPK